jgi:hypothetical protein
MTAIKLLQKANVLKKYEVYGYQISYYLLENEALAIEAATKALIEPINDDEFFHQTQSFQKQKTKQVFIKQRTCIRERFESDKAGYVFIPEKSEITFRSSTEKRSPTSTTASPTPIRSP